MDNPKKTPKAFSFMFENDFQRLCIHVNAFGDTVSYIVSECKNVDLIAKDGSWKPYGGDSTKWLGMLETLDVVSWDEDYPDTGVFPDSSAKWSLSLEDAPQGEPCETKAGMNSYPNGFTDFLELLKELLGIPVLLLEL